MSALDGAAPQVYLPGLDPMAVYPGATTTEAEGIRGRRAFFVKPHRPYGTPDEEWLGWEYADGAVAILLTHP